MIPYRPPHPLDLQRLKSELGCTVEQMADLAGLAETAQWQQYSGGPEPTRIDVHKLFFIAARLVLSPTQLRAIGQRMVEIGASIDPDQLPRSGKVSGA